MAPVEALISALTRYAMQAGKCAEMFDGSAAQCRRFSTVKEFGGRAVQSTLSTVAFCLQGNLSEESGYLFVAHSPSSYAGYIYPRLWMYSARSSQGMISWTNEIQNGVQNTALGHHLPPTRLPGPRICWRMHCTSMNGCGCCDAVMTQPPQSSPHFSNSTQLNSHCDATVASQHSVAFPDSPLREIAAISSRLSCNGRRTASLSQWSLNPRVAPVVRNDRECLMPSAKGRLARMSPGSPTSRSHGLTARLLRCLPCRQHKEKCILTARLDIPFD